MPSPVALRAFEAAARHLSFTLAAQELFVTQSAVSHQVKALEGDLGVRLFLRLTRQLRLTEAGERLQIVLRESFDRIEETVGEMRTGSGTIPLRVSMTSYFAARWLTRRLSEFSVLHPDIELHLHLTSEDVDFIRTDVDLAVAWGHGLWPGLEAELLIPSRIIAVCSPPLVNSGPPLREINDLNNHTLLHESDHRLWQDWLAAANVENVSLGRGVTMDDPNVVYQAAVEGQGVALGAEALLEDEISQGRLVHLFGRSVELDSSYYLVHPPDARKRLNVRTFCNWLLSEAKPAPPA
ncbi:MAG: transcriptional regulator GcvA [Hyphomicrobiaceae bacterium]